ncbi:SUMO ligase NFI1 [Sugiyamaella lignohabitans]|uniref:SUMO ligase NFI1 n=1 Tax=Sugiyamaella lignohabitans TaxID=796027 RepID=A0A161HLC9_9ASCO|nr:SUMO ligase NFI1 [Sugiyamaella lignohabitans]ANB14107.1 SUMO ligase NFI1 [Sugiyamaella lignohabitans]
MVDHTQTVYDEALSYISSVLTVTQLKIVLRNFGLAASGRKVELQNRLLEYLQIGLRKNDGERINRVHAALIDAVQDHPSSRSTALLNMGNRNPSSSQSPAPNRTGSQLITTRDWINSMTNPMTYTQQVNSIASGTTVNGTGPLAPQSGYQGSSASLFNGYASQYKPPEIPMINHQAINIVKSPFYDLTTRLHTPLIFQPPYSETNRRSTNFTLPDDIPWSSIESGEKQVYLLGIEYNVQSPEEHQHIYFPSITELVVSSQVIPVSATKGIRGKPGSTLPINVTPYVKKSHDLGRTRYTLDATINFPPKERDRPPDPNLRKTFIIMTFLAIPHSIEELIDNIKKQPWISRESVKQAIIDENQDEDVVATTTVHSLKDPVSYRRIDTPIRSMHCKHVDCLDAETFFQLQLQGPTWKCSICSNPITYDELRLDGYFKDILDNTDKNAEDVEILPDGTWVQKGVGAVDLSDSDDSEDDALTQRVKRQKVIKAEPGSADASMRSTPSVAVQSVAARRQEPEVIELSDSDDDMTDEAPPAMHQQQEQPVQQEAGQETQREAQQQARYNESDDFETITNLYGRNSFTGTSLLFGDVADGVVLDGESASVPVDDGTDQASHGVVNGVNTVSNESSDQPHTPTSNPPESNHNSPNLDDYTLSLQDTLLSSSLLFNKLPDTTAKVTQVPTPKDLTGDGLSTDAGNVEDDAEIALARARADVAATSTPEPTPAVTPRILDSVVGSTSAATSNGSINPDIVAASNGISNDSAKKDTIQDNGNHPAESLDVVPAIESIPNSRDTAAASALQSLRTSFTPANSEFPVQNPSMPSRPPYISQSSSNGFRTMLPKGPIINDQTSETRLPSPHGGPAAADTGSQFQDLTRRLHPNRSDIDVSDTGNPTHSNPPWRQNLLSQPPRRLPGLGIGTGLGPRPRSEYSNVAESHKRRHNSSTSPVEAPLPPWSQPSTTGLLGQHILHTPSHAEPVTGTFPPRTQPVRGPRAPPPAPPPIRRSAGNSRPASISSPASSSATNATADSSDVIDLTLSDSD